jgi:ATP-dependent Clp protease adaptor protein ClpS
MSLKKKRGMYKVILHNDNHNTFDHVIDSIMDICGYNYLQAVQCAVLVHEAKQCAIFEDKSDECEDVARLLNREGLKVTVKKCEK